MGYRIINARASYLRNRDGTLVRCLRRWRGNVPAYYYQECSTRSLSMGHGNFGKTPRDVTLCDTMTTHLPKAHRLFIMYAPHFSWCHHRPSLALLTFYRTMAAALRKVSQNYDWTIKRAHNDLHHNITTPQPQPQPQPTSPSFLATKPEDLFVSSWDVSVRFLICDSEGHV